MPSIFAEIGEGQHDDRQTRGGARRTCDRCGGGLGAGYRHDKPVTAGGDRLNVAAVGPSLVEDPAECGDLDRQIGIFDHRAPPDRRHDLFFGYEFARPFDEHAQDIERAGADGYRYEDAGFIASG